jgi:lipopolysaccharide transport system permease protein
MGKSRKASRWDIIISPRQKRVIVDISELNRYRDLIWLFVHRDFVSYYKQTILGPIWYVIKPLITSIVFAFIFGNVAKISTDGTPYIIFYMAGMINWTFFSETLISTSNTFRVNASIFSKVYFPRLVYSISQVYMNLIKFGFQYVLFFAVVLVFFVRGANIKPNYLIVFTPFVLLHNGLIALGFGLWVSSVTIKYRDLHQSLAFFIQLLLYVSPIIYPTSIIPENFKILYGLNPIVFVIEFFRKAYLGSGEIYTEHIVLSLGIMIIVLISGLMRFSVIEKKFLDYA